MQGDYQDAYDVLDSISAKSTQHFHRAATCGFLRHAQVCEVSYRQALLMLPFFVVSKPPLQ